MHNLVDPVGSVAIRVVRGEVAVTTFGHHGMRPHQRAVSWPTMKTYVAEIDGEAILAFRAEDDEAAGHVIGEEESGFQVVIRGYSGLLRADGRPLWDGTSPIRHRLASPQEHGLWLTVRSARTGPNDPNDWVVYLVPVVSIDEMVGNDEG
jgi:hypothetical protein